MSLSKRIGALLRETREGRKLTIADVSNGTNIIPKYIEALENEDFTIFPGETYASGFLRSYAEFLNLEEDHVIELYHGQKIDQSQVPVRELTRPIHATRVPIVDIIINHQKQIGVILMLLVLASAVIIGGSYGVSLLWSGFTGAGSSACKEKQYIPIDFAGVDSGNRMADLNKDNGASIRILSEVYQLCLVKVTGKEDSRRAHYAIMASDGDTYEFAGQEDESINISRKKSGFSSLSSIIEITPVVIDEDSSGVRIALKEDVTEPPPVAASGTLIRVTLEFTSESYLEWNSDGTLHDGVFLSRGEKRTFEAKNSLEIKLGNGGGVRVLRSGQEPRVAGPPQKIVYLTYRVVPNPLDPGKNKIEESIEVVR